MKFLSLNRNQLKYLVALAMLIDHAAWAFVPTASPAGQLMHLFGRLTGPTMAFFLAEGYLHTRDVKQYALRLGLFALLSWPAFSLFELGRWPAASFGVIYSLFLGLLAILLWERSGLPRFARILGAAALCFLSQWGDWPYFDVLCPLFLVIYREDPAQKWRSFFLLSAAMALTMLPGHHPWWRSAFQLGILLPPLLLRTCYNGQGGSRHPFHKWFFYLFYPIHLLILYGIRSGLL